MVRFHAFRFVLLAATMAIVSAGQAMATQPMTFHCNHADGVDAAAANGACAVFEQQLAHDKAPVLRADSTLHLNILNARPSSLRAILTVTAADGRTHSIDRALSASDRTISTIMQGAFFRRLIAEIPTDF